LLEEGQESLVTKEICYIKLSSHEKHFQLFQFKCQGTKPFDRLQWWRSCEHSYKFWTALWVGIYMLTQDAQKNSVETNESDLLKILVTTRNINVNINNMKTTVLHVTKNSAT
jgi:hypothetical protein